MGKIIAIVGGANQGKSFFTKEQIQDPALSCFVYDYQNCYGESSTKEGDIILNLPIATREMRCRWFGDENEFLRYCHLRRHTNIVIEEATIFFEGKTSKAMRKVMIDRFHHKNNIYIMFHSISAVPPRIMQMSDIVVLFKTGDEESDVKRKYAKLLPAFLELQGKPDRSRLIIKNI